VAHTNLASIPSCACQGLLSRGRAHQSTSVASVRGAVDHPQVDRWLSGGLRTKARIITAADDASWSEVADLVSAAEVDGACPHGMFTRDSVRWAVGVLLSRSVRLDSAGGETVLVPFADFANHSVDADCFLDFDAGSGAVGVRLDRGYAPGEQVRGAGVAQLIRCSIARCRRLMRQGVFGFWTGGVCRSSPALLAGALSCIVQRRPNARPGLRHRCLSAMAPKAAARWVGAGGCMDTEWWLGR
jgi:hypothetical protein